MNAQEIYKQAVESVTSSPEDIKKRQAQADAEQKNLEAWAQWRQLPQTIIFIEKLKIVASIIDKQAAAFASNVPGVSNDYLRARLVESNLLSEIIDITVKNGQLKENILKEYIS